MKYLLFIIILFFFSIVNAEDDYEIELEGTTILDVCKWAERNTIMHFKINRNLEIYWNELTLEKRADSNLKQSHDRKMKSNLEALDKNAKKYHYLNCYEQLKGK